ncbi:MAG: GNAT family N-acetyltransferase [Gemmatimonadota bacterium]|nr:GNAT family N-acetyltransferase [Gemmatimonadota bacterium]
MELAISPAVSTTAAGETEQAVAVIALAFSTDPVARWSLPDPSQYLIHFPAVVRAFGGRAFTHGTGHHSADFAGAALWLPPGVSPDEEALGAAVEASVSPKRQPEVFALFEQMAGYHPSAPHWYLPLIGVDPLHQGKGHGSALLQHALIQCDRDHAPAYLESTNPANIPLYQRHGFEIIATIQEGSSPPIVPMLRGPR